MRKKLDVMLCICFLIGMLLACGGERNLIEDNNVVTVVETEVPTDMAPLEKYYGYYQIAEFLPSLYWLRGSGRYDWLPEQEADMLLGRVIELSKDRLITYDSLRKLRKKDGRVAFPGNYFIEEIIIEKPQYSWELVDADTVDTFYTSDIIPYLDLIEGKISIQIASSWGEHE